MLNRNDLVKQFELVVKQEIKNHQDSILSTNLAINSMKDAIKDLSDKSSMRCASLESRLGSLEAQILAYSSDISKIEEKSNSKINDIHLSTLEMEKRLPPLEESQEKFCNDINQIDAGIKTLFDLDEDKFIRIRHLGQDIEIMNSRLFNKILKEIEKCKEEILSIPSEIPSVKEEFEKRITSFEFDAKSLLVNLNAHKRTVLVVEKNIENIYTQINRLKEE